MNHWFVFIKITFRQIIGLKFILIYLIQMRFYTNYFQFRLKWTLKFSFDVLSPQVIELDQQNW
jgi:hypothetical protein